ARTTAAMFTASCGSTSTTRTPGRSCADPGCSTTSDIAHHEANEVDRALAVAPEVDALPCSAGENELSAAAGTSRRHVVDHELDADHAAAMGAERRERNREIHRVAIGRGEPASGERHVGARTGAGMYSNATIRLGNREP